MLSSDVVDLLHSGCSLVVGLVTAAGRPQTGRAWGLSLADDHRTARVVLSAADVASLGHLAGARLGTIAVNGADVLTLRSVQLKGPIAGVERADGRDAARMAAHCDAFFDAVAVADAIPRSRMERLLPAEVVACTFEIVEAYDQTPGPAAGRPLDRGPA